MSDTKLVPYLFFQGNCRQAMEFYKGVFDGELVIQTMGEAPVDMPVMEGRDDQIMHAQLTSGMVEIMGSDSPDASPAAAKVELSFVGSDEPKLRAIFDALAEGGNVRMPLEKQFWGDHFGTLTDKFGIDWMVNIEGAKG